MSFHRRYALRGFFGNSGSDGDTGSDGEVTLESLLPDNAGIYYQVNAKSDTDFPKFETDAVGAVEEE